MGERHFGSTRNSFLLSHITNMTPLRPYTKKQNGLTTYLLPQAAVGTVNFQRSFETSKRRKGKLRCDWQQRVHVTKYSDVAPTATIPPPPKYSSKANVGNMLSLMNLNVEVSCQCVVPSQTNKSASSGWLKTKGMVESTPDNSNLC